MIDKARAVYGVLLLAAPDTLGRLVSGSGLSKQERTVARVLGARHLAQFLAYGLFPGRAMRMAGAATDALHGLSMVLAAIVLPRERGLVLTDSAVAFTFTGIRSCNKAPRQAVNNSHYCVINGLRGSG
jgi:hypothetical protein